jgi:hypothetical protein
MQVVQTQGTAFQHQREAVNPTLQYTPLDQPFGRPSL